MDPENVLRFGPSGPPVVNANGGTFSPGKGARIRLIEFSEVIGDGSVPIPTFASEVTLDGFTGPATLRPILGAPQRGLSYRARGVFDAIENSTTTSAEVEVFLDTSIDNGSTWVNQASNVHLMATAQQDSPVRISGRQCEICMPATPGSVLGILADGSTTNLLLRMRLLCTANVSGSAAGVELWSPVTPNPGVPDNSIGTFHMELEEVF